MNATRTGFLTLTIYVSFTTLFIWNAAVHSPAIDEVGHLPSGISHLQLGRFELYAVNPPLAESCAALPVLLYKPQVNWSGYLPSISSRSEFIVGRRFVAANGSAAPILFFLGRIALFPFSVMAMSVASRWSRSLLSKVGAVIVLLMFASCPLFLANASLITPDVTATAVGLLAIYCFRVWLKDSSWFHSFVLGLVTGLGLISKFTWCVVFPGTAVVILILNRFFDRRNFLRDVLQLGVASLVAVFVVNSAYGFDGSFRQIRDFEFVCKALRQQDNVAVNNRFCGTILECLPIPLPACYVLGIDAQKRDFDFGFRSYLIGEWKHGGWWYYYIVGFLVKETIGFQLMLYSSVVHGLWDWRKWTRETVREWSLIVVPPLLIFGLVSSQTGFNHHMRYVLPAYPFLFIIAARTVTLGKFWKWFSYACLTWQAASVLWF
ncbi:MAG: glycosyltransferase family 39 protein, partial [Planctomycetota bacterium]